jgi:hypothetical protein
MRIISIFLPLIVVILEVKVKITRTYIIRKVRMPHIVTPRQSRMAGNALGRYVANSARRRTPVAAPMNAPWRTTASESRCRCI